MMNPTFVGDVCGVFRCIRLQFHCGLLIVGSFQSSVVPPSIQGWKYGLKLLSRLRYSYSFRPCFPFSFSLRWLLPPDMLPLSYNYSCLALLSSFLFKIKRANKLYMFIRYILIKNSSLIGSPRTSGINLFAIV